MAHSVYNVLTTHFVANNRPIRVYFKNDTLPCTH